MLTQLFTHKPIKNLFSNSLLIVALTATTCNAYAQSSNQGKKSSLSARLVNVEASTNEPFRYNSVLTNESSEAANYNLQASLPAGWQITYRVEGTTVTSFKAEPNRAQDISIEISCTLTTKPDTYKIPVKAISSKDTLQLDLEAVVRGSYSVELTTPTGKLSDEIVAGSSKELLFVVKNTGTLPLNALELSSQLPTRWETSFAPSNIDQLEPGKQVDVKVTLKVPEKTIAGDYSTKITARSANSSSEASVRIIVKTSIFSSWIGLVVIAAAAGLIYYLIRRYGRR